MFDNHQQVIKSRPRSLQPSDPSVDSVRDDPFAALVLQVAEDPANAFNIGRYLWVLEEPLRACDVCGELFDPCFAHEGGPAHGLPRQYCSPRCGWRAAERRRRIRMAARLEMQWGRAA